MGEERMKKLIILFILVGLFLASTGCSSSEVEKEITLNPFLSSKIIASNIEKIDFVSAKEDKVLFSVKEKKILESLTTMFLYSKDFMGDNRLKNNLENKMIIYKNDGEKIELKYKYNDLYEIGYIEYSNKRFAPSFDFFRYVNDLFQYKKHDTEIEQDVIDLFQTYHWTVDYKINTFIENLPTNVKHEAGEFPTKLYWAYNNELSKEISLNYSNYFGKTIKVDLYRLREPLPTFMKPRQSARGIVLKHNDRIIGAYIDAGRHSAFASSLNRKKLSDITKKEWDFWINDYINPNNTLDAYLTERTPEEIVKEYFKGVNTHDNSLTYGTLTKNRLTSYLFANMDNNQLFNERYPVNNINSVRLIEIRKLDIKNSSNDIIEYEIKADYDYIKQITEGDGEKTKFFLLKKESDQLGWRIESIGTTP